MAVYGVSVDDVESHQKFAAKQSFNFPLLADTGEKVCAAFGVKVQDGKYPERVTFVVAKDGVIKKVYPKVNPKDHATEVLGLLQ